MTEDIPFMHHSAWMDGDLCKFSHFCPVPPAVAAKKTTSGRRKSNTKSDASDEKVGQLSALEQQFDWELHQMVGYMLRLDGDYGVTSKDGFRFMDPLAPDGEPKFATNGSRTPFFGFWFFYAWDNVFAPSLVKTFGPVVKVTDKEDLDRLLSLDVMM